MGNVQRYTPGNGADGGNGHQHPASKTSTFGKVLNGIQNFGADSIKFLQSCPQASAGGRAGVGMHLRGTDRPHHSVPAAPLCHIHTYAFCLLQVELKLIVGLGPLFVPPNVKPELAGAFNFGLVKCVLRYILHVGANGVEAAAGSDDVLSNPGTLVTRVEASPVCMCARNDHVAPTGPPPPLPAPSSSPGSRSLRNDLSDRSSRRAPSRAQ